MSYIKIIEKGIDVKPFLKVLEDNPEDWDYLYKLTGVNGVSGLNQSLMPMIMGYVIDPNQDIKDSEFQEDTEIKWKHHAIFDYLKSYGIEDVCRAGYFKLPLGGKVIWHYDDGEYYTTKDRYHLSLQGRYRYKVEDEEIVVEPGTFFWFDNKAFHESENIGETDRITFVFDAFHNPNNPQNRI